MHGTEGDKDRRVIYSDGDVEDLSLVDLQVLSILEDRDDKKKPRSSTKTPKNHSNSAEIPLVGGKSGADSPPDQSQDLKGRIRLRDTSGSSDERAKLKTDVPDSNRTDEELDTPNFTKVQLKSPFEPTRAVATSNQSLGMMNQHDLFNSGQPPHQDQFTEYVYQRQQHILSQQQRNLGTQHHNNMLTHQFLKMQEQQLLLGQQTLLLQQMEQVRLQQYLFQQQQLQSTFASADSPLNHPASASASTGYMPASSSVQQEMPPQLMGARENAAAASAVPAEAKTKGKATTTKKPREKRMKKRKLPSKEDNDTCTKKPKGAQGTKRKARSNQNKDASAKKQTAVQNESSCKKRKAPTKKKKVMDFREKVMDFREKERLRKQEYRNNMSEEKKEIERVNNKLAMRRKRKADREKAAKARRMAAARKANNS